MFLCSFVLAPVMLYGFRFHLSADIFTVWIGEVSRPIFRPLSYGPAKLADSYISTTKRLISDLLSFINVLSP